MIATFTIFLSKAGTGVQFQFIQLIRPVITTTMRKQWCELADIGFMTKTWSRCADSGRWEAEPDASCRRHL